MFISLRYFLLAIRSLCTSIVPSQIRVQEKLMDAENVFGGLKKGSSNSDNYYPLK